MKEFEKEFLFSIDNLIEENLTNPDFQLEDVTIALEISRAKLYRSVLKLTGSSPAQYIKNTRLIKAMDILKRGVYPTVKETTASVGFRSPEYFTKQFYKEFNILPSQLIRE